MSVVDQLSAAAKAGEAVKIAQFLHKGGNRRTLLDTYNSTGQTVPVVAADYGKLNVVKVLLKAKANFNIQDTIGTTPLIAAICSAAEDVYTLLISCKNVDINMQDREGMTSLHWAARLGDTKCVECLLSNYRIDCSLTTFGKDNLNNTPFLTACETGGNIAILQLFIDKLTAESHLSSTLDLEEINKDGYNGLCFAVKQGHLQETKLLLNHCHPNVITVDGSPLHIGVQSRNPSIVEALLNCKQIDLKVKNRNKQTPLQLAEELSKQSASGNSTEIDIIKSLLATANDKSNFYNPQYQKQRTPKENRYTTKKGEGKIYENKNMGSAGNRQKVIDVPFPQLVPMLFLFVLLIYMYMVAIM